ncbi:ATP-binding cassette domain-containing protein [Amaricoccus sp. W119]|uniref:ATP-binding cassette domain-containing protein n=1 Tax=Amaricoccus sp. W119 TaxID=3391833 RepID=UPI0039A76FEB
MFARARSVRALKGIDFRVEKGKTLAIVGESGSGKSTLARIVALIDPPTEGELLIEGAPWRSSAKAVPASLRWRVSSR